MGVGANFTEKLMENRVGSELMVNTCFLRGMVDLQATKRAKGSSCGVKLLGGGLIW